MDPLLRTFVFGTSMLTCIAGHAEVRRPCVTTLEAQPMTEVSPSPLAATSPSSSPQKPTTSPRKPCPVAIVYVPGQTPDPSRRERLAQDATGPVDDRV